MFSDEAKRKKLRESENNIVESTVSKSFGDLLCIYVIEEKKALFWCQTALSSGSEPS